MADTIILTTLKIDEFKLLITDTVCAELRKQLSSKFPNETTDTQFTRKETAGMLKISLGTLLTYTKNGKIKAHRIGRRILYKKSSIQAAMQTLNFNPYNDENNA